MAETKSDESQCGGAAARKAGAGKMKGLIHNEDPGFFMRGGWDFTKETAGGIIDRNIDLIANSGVTALMLNTNVRRANYRSDVWAAYWDGYDPDGPDDQPFLAGIPDEAGRKRWRMYVGNMLEVHRQGIDFPARVIERCRRRNVSPWISLRMNDVHDASNPRHPRHTELWLRKDLSIRGGRAGFVGAAGLDYAHQEVRDHFRALIAETFDRYDADGLELDFLREPYLFSAGKEQEGREILTAWLRDIRKLADEASRRRGRRVNLGVRVPSCPETALALGLDAPAWAAERSVDLVVVSPRYQSLEFDLPLEKWRDMLGPDVSLAGGLEVGYMPCHEAGRRMVTPDLARGAAVAARGAGADAVYLFNYFQDLKQWPSSDEYQAVLKSLSSLETSLAHPRRHAVTNRHPDVPAPGVIPHTPLPAAGTTLSFGLPLGPAPPRDVAGRGED